MIAEADTVTWTEADVSLALRWADLYRLRGYNVLPSDPRLGHPPLAYRQWWDAPAPATLFDSHPLPSIQVMCGRRWKLLVIDLDGPEAPDVWSRRGRAPRTWTTHSGGGGMHLWFTIPADAPPLPKGFLWKGEGKHSAIERLGDGSLVTAPPSLHRKSGRRYRFLDRARSPLGMPLPAPCPAWLLGWETIRPEVGADGAKPKFRKVRNLAPARPTGVMPGRDEVLAGLPDKIGLARSWGVRFVGRPTQAGWHPCRAIDREDRTPSAAVHAATGCYTDRGSGLRLSFFDLAVALGVYRDFRETIAHLGGHHAR